jgi:hypothetical protein
MQMNKKGMIFTAALFGSIFTAFIIMASDREITFKPKDGYVPNAETAIRIAEAVWIPIYGEQRIEGEKPFRAQLLRGNIWRVEGTLKAPSGGTNDIVVGGVAVAEIAKDDGRIIRVIHGK